MTKRRLKLFRIIKWVVLIFILYVICFLLFIWGNPIKNYFVYIKIKNYAEIKYGEPIYIKWCHRDFIDGNYFAGAKTVNEKKLDFTIYYNAKESNSLFWDDYYTELSKYYAKNEIKSSIANVFNGGCELYDIDISIMPRTENRLYDESASVEYESSIQKEEFENFKNIINGNFSIILYFKDDYKITDDNSEILTDQEIVDCYKSILDKDYHFRGLRIKFKRNILTKLINFTNEKYRTIIYTNFDEQTNETEIEGEKKNSELIKDKINKFKKVSSSDCSK